MIRRKNAILPQLLLCCSDFLATFFKKADFICPSNKRNSSSLQSTYCNFVVRFMPRRYCQGMISPSLALFDGLSILFFFGDMAPGPALLRRTSPRPAAAASFLLPYSCPHSRPNLPHSTELMVAHPARPRPRRRSDRPNERPT